MVDILSCTLETETGGTFDNVLEYEGGVQEVKIHGTYHLDAILALEVIVELYINGSKTMEEVYSRGGGDHQYEVIDHVDPEAASWLGLDPGGSYPVEVQIRTPAETERRHCDDVRIESIAAPSFEVTDCDVSPSTAAPDETVTVTATIENNGDAEGDVEVQWYADNQLFEEFSGAFAIHLNPGQSKTFDEDFVPENVTSADSIPTSVQIRDVTGQTATNRLSRV